jgi:hypothetical protein
MREKLREEREEQMGVRDCFEVKEREEGRGRVAVRYLNKRWERKTRG